MTAAFAAALDGDQDAVRGLIAVFFASIRVYAPVEGPADDSGRAALDALAALGALAAVDAFRGSLEQQSPPP